MKQFALNLKNRRKRMGFTQEELATATGLHKSTIISYEKGRTQPTKHNGFLIAACLQTTLDELSGLETDEPELMDVPLFRIPSPGTPLLRETNQVGTASVDVRLGIGQCLLAKDNSMAGAGIERGDIVKFRRQLDEVPGDLTLVDVKGKGVLIRRVVQVDEAGISLAADREGDCEPSEEQRFMRGKNGKLTGCKVIGKVVKVSRSCCIRKSQPVG